MKLSRTMLASLILSGAISSSHALEIDEKLTLRFLKVSASQKTVLINRGAEDGLVIGDHAKFYITAGVIARGVVEKVSPSRSVWSLYRVVDPNEISEDKVLNLKIATPVRLTTDPSKSLKEEAIPGGDDVMVTTTTTSSGGIAIDDAEREELRSMGFEDIEDVTPAKKSPAGKVSARPNSARTVDEAIGFNKGATSARGTWELWGSAYVNALTGTSEESSETTTSDSISSSGSTVAFSAGVEKYFYDYDNFLKNFSVSLFAHMRSIESGDKVKSKTDWFEYGGIVNYHFYNSPQDLNKLIGFGTAALGVGSASIDSKVVVNGVDNGEPSDGSNSFMSFGVGAKYFLANGFGVRAILDYYNSTETYEFETTTQERTLSGPRIQMGLSYRF